MVGTHALYRKCMGKKIVSCGGVFDLAVEQPQLFRKLQNIYVYIYIYEFQGVWGGRTWSNVHFLFIIQKHGKSTRALNLYLNQILDHYDFKKIPRINNKNLRKWGPRGPSPVSLRSEYSRSN